MIPKHDLCYLIIPFILNARFEKGHNLFPLILHCRGETSKTLGKRLYLLIPTNLQLGSRKGSKMTFKPVITHFHGKWPLESLSF